MNSAASPPPSTREELGGRFFHVTDGHSEAIVTQAFAGTGFEGLMSPVAVNARNRPELHAWVESRLPGASERLRGVDQVHSAVVVAASELRRGARREADGVWSTSGADIPVVMAADCAPVWLADASTGVFALVHAGWRGVAGGIVESGLLAVMARGARPDTVIAAIGPHLRPCCFEVGPEVALRFPGHTRPASVLRAERMRSDSVALDLASAISTRLQDAGVRTVETAEACTRCRADLLHSYRRNGKGGPLMAALAVLPFPEVP